MYIGTRTDARSAQNCSCESTRIQSFCVIHRKFKSVAQRMPRRRKPPQKAKRPRSKAKRTTEDIRLRSVARSCHNRGRLASSYLKLQGLLHVRAGARHADVLASALDRLNALVAALLVSPHLISGDTYASSTHVDAPSDDSAVDSASTSFTTTDAACQLLSLGVANRHQKEHCCV